MHYEINVAKNGKHLFATHERSLRDKDKAKSLLDEMEKRFPKNEGFSILCTTITRNQVRTKF